MNLRVIECCPLCGNDGPKELFHSRVWGGENEERFVRCTNCDVVFLHPFPEPGDIDSFYSQDFGTYMLDRSPEIEWHDLVRQYDNLSRRELPLRDPILKQHLVNGSVLEIGASTGFLLDHLRKRGRICCGVEPAKRHAEFARSRGNAIVNDLDNVNCAFDNVLHYYVLEHVRNPLEFMRSCIDLAKPGGRIIFECPHRDDALLAYYRIPAYRDFILQKMHLFYFSVAALTWLMKSLGLSYVIKQGQRYGLENHLGWMTHGKSGGCDMPKIFGDKADQAYREDIIRAGFGDYLCVVGVKE